MSLIVLISCSSRKLSRPSPARNLYTGSLFKKSLNCAINLQPQPKHIFILSAKYGLVDLNTQISPYNLTLNKMGNQQRMQWANNVLNSLKQHCSLSDDCFIIFAGMRYWQFLVPHLRHYCIPLRGMPIGKQLQFLSSLQTCDCHTLCSSSFCSKC